MENKQFNQEDVDQIKQLQEKYSILGVQLVQIKLARKNALDYLEKLDAQEKEVEDHIQNTNQEEKQLAESFSQKYGAGSLDLESGVFTPKIA